MSNSLSGFSPRGVLKRTREMEYDSYCQGIEDVMDLLSAEQDVQYEFRNRVLSLVVEAADDF